MSDVTQILAAVEAGDSTTAARLPPLAYDELRKLAAARMPGRAARPPQGSDSPRPQAVKRVGGA